MRPIVGLTSGTPTGSEPLLDESVLTSTRACPWIRGTNGRFSEPGTSPKNTGRFDSLSFTSTIAALQGGCSTVSSGAGSPARGLGYLLLLTARLTDPRFAPPIWLL